MTVYMIVMTVDRLYDLSSSIVQDKVLIMYNTTI